ncbi:MAG: NAD(P)H-hydrate dehydratase [candidate division Zixibacteria bacterium]|nr:NAD(P)H-hydrate dehydratase [candidate division Zixibacteria bacterium]NIT52210.1 NAD(P)H-hydrate dehydratase [candidate division Zixibacteria bacterium]
MKIVTAEQMQDIDKTAIKGRGIPSLELMENAGRGIAEYLYEISDDDVTAKSVAVICGKGNNGGDGFVVGRYLSELGADVRFYLLGKKDELKGDAEINHKRAHEINLPIHEISSADEIDLDEETDLIVDAIFGTGFHGDIRSPMDKMVDKINSYDIPIAAVDCPSGLNTTTGELSKSSIIADFTATLAMPKIGHFLYPGVEHVGELTVIDIGIPEEVVEEKNLDLNLIDEAFIDEYLPHHSEGGHKGNLGKLFIIAGSEGSTGAACMAANSATRAGIGLCFLGVPESLNDICEVKCTEALTRTLPEVGKKRCFALRGLGKFKQYFEWADAVALGPGIGTHHETKELVKRLISRIKLPTVIDADGLNCFEGDTQPLIEAEFPCVLTPHPGELSRLIDTSLKEIAADRFKYARIAADHLKKVVLLKGAPTFVAEPNGQVYLNPTGNIGMAKGGSGDVLTGLIGTLLAKGLSPLQAACCGAYLHGMAGDFCRDEIGSMGMIPTDMIDMLPEVLLYFRE